jgi:hypothetical protein
VAVEVGERIRLVAPHAADHVPRVVDGAGTAADALGGAEVFHAGAVTLAERMSPVAPASGYFSAPGTLAVVVHPIGIRNM